MNFKTFLTAVSFLLLVLSGHTAHEQSKYPFIKYCQHFKYPVEQHFAVTGDGYILRMFRIQKKQTSIKSGLQPILLQHGLLDSSDTWIINDQDKAPAFMLANEGYDVWLGNNRGNKHSRNHTTYNPDKNAVFWEFTFQHMASQDLPTMLKYVKNKTEHEGKIHYIGHSQGSVQMHIALATHNPVVQELLGKYFAFGPVAYVKYSQSRVMNLLSKSGLIAFYNIRGIHEFMPSLGWFTTDVGVAFCSAFPKVCADILAQVMDADPSVDNYQRYDVLVGHAPSGTSIMNMKHWKQLLDNGTFQAYDYGSSTKNQEHYGQPYPPNYSLEKIRMPMRLFAGNSDLLADKTDVNFLWNSLDPSVKEFFRTYEAGHCTFMWGISTRTWMDEVKSMLREERQQ